MLPVSFMSAILCHPQIGQFSRNDSFIQFRGSIPESSFQLGLDLPIISPHQFRISIIRIAQFGKRYYKLFGLFPYNIYLFGSEMEKQTRVEISTHPFNPLSHSQSHQWAQNPDIIPRGLIYKSSKFCMVLKHFQLLPQEIHIRMDCLYSNGTPINIPRQLINYQQVCELDDDRAESVGIKLSFPIGFSSWASIKQKLERKVAQVSQIIDNSLQTLGLIKQSNCLGSKLKQNQIRLKKQVLDHLKASEAQAKSSMASLFQSINSLENNSIKKVNEIEPISSSNQPLKKEGGYYQVLGQDCKITDSQGSYIQLLAAKASKGSSSSANQKLKKEIEFVKKISNQKYLGTYYQCQNESNKLYMNFISHNLKDFIYAKPISLKQSLEMGFQLVCGVMNLHDSGIIHRDLKPENILVEVKDDKKFVRIIDFGESSTVEDKFDPKNQLGCTLPYSPPECRIQPEQGLNKKQIDQWSLVMILYQMTFKCLPMSFSRIIGRDIIESWKDPEKFSIYPLYHKRNGIRGMEEIISLLAISGLKINQQSRISLTTMGSILQLIQEYESECSKAVFDI